MATPTPPPPPPDPVSVFLVLDRSMPGLPLPAQDEVRDTGMDTEAGYVVEVKSYHLGLVAPPGAAARSEPLVLTKQVDQVSPTLVTAFGKGQPLSSLKLVLREKGNPIMTYTFSNARLTGLTWSTSNGDDVAEEHLSLAYEAVTAVHTPKTMDMNGRVRATGPTTTSSHPAA